MLANDLSGNHLSQPAANVVASLFTSTSIFKQVDFIPSPDNGDYHVEGTMLWLVSRDTYVHINNTPEGLHSTSHLSALYSLLGRIDGQVSFSLEYGMRRLVSLY